MSPFYRLRAQGGRTEEGLWSVSWFRVGVFSQVLIMLLINKYRLKEGPCLNSNESVPLTLKKKSLWAEPRVKGADNVHDTHTGRRVSIPGLCRLTEKRRQLWRSGHQGAVGREEALH